MRKHHAAVGVGGVQVRAAHGGQQGAQVVAFGRHKPQRAVHVDGGALGDLAAAGLQNGVGDLSGRHHIGADGQRKGRVKVPVRHRSPSGFQQGAGGVHAGLYIGAGGIKILLVGNIADDRAVDLHPQGKGLCQCGLHQPRKSQRPQRRDQQPQQCFGAGLPQPDARQHNGPQQRRQQRTQCPAQPAAKARQPAQQTAQPIFNIKAKPIQEIHCGT